MNGHQSGTEQPHDPASDRLAPAAEPQCHNGAQAPSADRQCHNAPAPSAERHYYTAHASSPNAAPEHRGVTGGPPPNAASARAERAAAPLLTRDDHASPSIFRPENMLREARRQKGLCLGSVAPLCILDPDGDVVRHVRQTRQARRSPHWACYHTEMWEWEDDGRRYGIVGCAVGASFAVLVAEQLFVSGCELLISIASAGQIADLGQPPYHIVIERALRDEGTSYHYLPASDYVEVEAGVRALVGQALGDVVATVHHGSTWTTDAPFRETAETIAARRDQGILAVEMEAAALYAFGQARGKSVLCLAHVTNQLGCVHGDFEKGDCNGARGSLELIQAIARRWSLPRNTDGLTSR